MGTQRNNTNWDGCNLPDAEVIPASVTFDVNMDYSASSSVTVFDNMGKNRPQFFTSKHRPIKRR